jgi:hypothetical protein
VADLIGSSLSVPMALLAATRPGQPADHVIRVVPWLAWEGRVEDVRLPSSPQSGRPA